MRYQCVHMRGDAGFERTLDEQIIEADTERDALEKFVGNADGKWEIRDGEIFFNYPEDGGYRGRFSDFSQAIPLPEEEEA